ncbi:MAG TPA: TRAP transporter substrate-binding protein [Xanthobacteraceae bacterium]|jgi:TRAP-type C4-dicarboxylate transport system substrate-binding protein|nr:TRAP transporter substrate-binding protein [Xanthobacteraceae bacterium]
MSGFARRGFTHVNIALSLVWSLILFLSAAQSPASAQDKTYTMKISLATINDQIHALVKNYAAALEKDSGGRIKTEVYPASQLGSIPRQTEGVQFGAIQCQVVPPEFLVGLDERFEVMAAPGLVASMAQGQRIAADPEVLKLMLGLGADKGLHGAGMMMVNPSAIAFRTPVRTLADFKGKKVRIFASAFQSTSFDRLGATPVAMSLGDVLPALQQGAIDGAVASTAIFTAFHYQDAAKYALETGQPAIFAIIEVSKKWYDTLPPDLQQVIDKTAARETVTVNPQAAEITEKSRKIWTDTGGELISLSPQEQAQFLKILLSVGQDVAKTKPLLDQAYQVIAAASERTK